jgi:hypothetical protein
MFYFKESLFDKRARNCYPQSRLKPNKSIDSKELEIQRLCFIFRALESKFRLNKRIGKATQLKPKVNSDQGGSEH